MQVHYPLNRRLRVLAAGDHQRRARVIPLNVGDSFTFEVPVTTYGQLQAFGLSTEGRSTLQFTLNYADGTSDVRTIEFGDWFDDPALAGQFFIINRLDRYSSSYSASREHAVTRVNPNPNTSKTLASVTVQQPVRSFFVFQGALGD